MIEQMGVSGGERYLPLVEMMTQKKQNGFTLIEVLVAVTILAVISFLVFQAMGTSTASKERFEKKDQTFRSASLGMEAMSRALGSAVLYAGPEFLGMSVSGEVMTKSVFIGVNDGDQDKLTFDTFSHIRYLKDVKESDLAEVSFYLEPAETEGPEGEMVSSNALMKREKSPLDNDTDQGGTVMTLLEGVKSLRLRYFDKRKGEFVEEWDSTKMDNTGKMPRAVEITLVVQDPVDEDVELPFKTTVFLEMAPGPNDFP